MRRRLQSYPLTGEEVLVFAGPGAGKTLGALLAFSRMQQESHLKRVLVFCHRTSILEQWDRAAARLNLTMATWPCPQEMVSAADGVLLTYQAAGRQPQLLETVLRDWAPETSLAIADEAHHLGLDPDDPSAAAWGQTFQELTAGCRLRLGLTGTPFRADSRGFCAARRVRVVQHGQVVEQIQPDLCVEPRELIAAGDVRPLEFRFQDGLVEHSQPGRPDRDVSPLSTEHRESWRARNLRRAIRLADTSCIGQQVLLQAQQRLTRIRRSQPNAAGLVIARDIDHASAIAAVLKEDGHRVDLVHSKDPEAAERLNRFQSGAADWLVSIDMCTEGFDAPRLRVVAYMTTVVTRSRFVQGITRAVRMSAELAEQEPIPRRPSYVFAPADPLLMRYARSWSIAEPYVLQSRLEPSDEEETAKGSWRGPSLPLEAVEDEAAGMISLNTPQLPSFLQR